MLTNEEIKIIKNLIIISKQIYDSYLNLYNLEITNQKDSNEYLKEYEKLKELLEQENMLYSILPYNNSDKMKEYISYLERNYNFDKTKEISGIYDWNDSKYIERVYDKLIALTCKYAPKYMEETKNKYKILSLNQLYLKDISNIFIHYLDEEISSQDNNTVKNRLKLYKHRFNYQEAFTKEDNEIFSKSEGLVIYANRFMRKNNISDKALDKFNKESQASIAAHLFKIKDLNDSFEDNKAEIITRICHIKACLLVLSNHRYNDISSSILNLIEKLRLLDYILPLELRFQSELCDLLDKAIVDVIKDRKHLIK